MRRTIAIMALLFAQQASAAITINIYETGGNVQATLSGSVDLASLTNFVGNSLAYNGFLASSGGVAFGAGNTDYYSISAGTWAPFGGGGFGEWDTSNGDSLALFTNPQLGVPAGYSSGSALSATATRNSTTLAALGMVPGEYVTTLTNGNNTDTVTVIVGDAPPPPPAPSATAIPTMSIYGVALTVLGLLAIAVRRLSGGKLQQ